MAPGPVEERTSTVLAVFIALDRDGDHLLNQRELEAYARCSHFVGDESEWAEEYVDLCGMAQCSPRFGLPLAEFRRLVDDAEYYGTYSSLHELKAIQAALAYDAALEAAQAGSPAGETASGSDGGIDALGSQHVARQILTYCHYGSCNGHQVQRDPDGWVRLRDLRIGSRGKAVEEDSLLAIACASSGSRGHHFAAQRRTVPAPSSSSSSARPTPSAALWWVRALNPQPAGRRRRHSSRR